MSKRAEAPGFIGIDVSRLPPLLRRLVKAMGEALAFRLVEVRGGTPICVPTHFVADHYLLPILGVDGLVALIREAAGEELQLPKMDSLLRQLRHRRVLELLDQGHPHSAVALRTNYSVRHVINIKQSDEGAPTTQGDLFGEAAVSEPADKVASKVDALPTAHNPFGL